MVGQQHQSIKAEDWNSDWHAITIAPMFQTVGYNTKNYKYAYQKARQLFKQYVELHLKNIKNCKFDLFFETSPTGRQHYHGFIKVECIQEFLTYGIQVLIALGSLCIKPLDDDLCNRSDNGSWAKYCTKQQHLWDKSLRIEINTCPIKEIEDPPVLPEN